MSDLVVKAKDGIYQVSIGGFSFSSKSEEVVASCCKYSFKIIFRASDFEFRFSINWDLGFIYYFGNSNAIKMVVKDELLFTIDDKVVIEVKKLR